MQRQKVIQKSLILVALLGAVYFGWQAGHAIWNEIMPYHPYRTVIFTPELIDQMLQSGDPFYAPSKSP